jgi:hypothetical protein
MLPMALSTLNARSGASPWIAAHTSARLRIVYVQTHEAQEEVT